MKWMLCIVLVLAACSPLVEPDAPETLQEETQEVEEMQEPAEPVIETTPEETKNSEDLAEEPKEEELVVAATSLAQEYLDEFTEEVEFYTFTYEHPEYDQITIAWWPKFTKYYAQDNYWKINFETVERGWSVTESYIEENREDLQEKQNRHIEYIWRSAEGFSGCMRDMDSFTYTKKNCLLDEDEEPVIYTGLDFDAPRLPHEWLYDFTDKEPVEVRTNRAYKENAANHVVDQVYYDNGDGTETLLYVHTGHKIPLKVEFLKDRKVVDEVSYENIAFNRKSIWDEGVEI